MYLCAKDFRKCLCLSLEILRLEWADLVRRPGFVEIAADK
jgi:hypothetical protein